MVEGRRRRLLRILLIVGALLGIPARAVICRDSEADQVMSDRGFHRACFK